VPSHELCFLRVYEIPLQMGSDREVPYHFLRYFLVPYLVSSLAAHRTCDSLRILIPIKCAIIDAGMVLNVWQVQRAHDFLGLLDISWTVFPLGRHFCQNLMFLLKLTSVHLLSAFISRALSVTLKRVSSGRHPGSNRVFLSISICSSLAFSLVAVFALLVSLRSSF
jgi:hypothetical protein